MLEILKENNPVAKKDHVCQFCGGVIKEGERYNRATISYNGDVYDWKSHLHCLELTVNLDMNRFCEDCGLTEEGYSGRFDRTVYYNLFNEESIWETSLTDFSTLSFEAQLKI